MSQVLEKIIIPKKHDHIPAFKTAQLKIITKNDENSLNVIINDEIYSDALPIFFNERFYRIQLNYQKLDELKNHRQKLLKDIATNSNPETIQKTSQAQIGLLQLLYEHTSTVLEDLDNYEHPKKNGRIKHDLLIEQDRMYFISSRIKIHARRFKQLFDKLKPMMDDDHFGNYEEKVKKIEGDDTANETKLELIYDLAIIAKENLPEKIKTVNEEVEEPIFDNPNEVTE